MVSMIGAIAVSAGSGVTPDPELRKVAIELAELAIENGIDVNLLIETDRGTFLHLCVLLHDPAIAMETVSDPATVGLVWNRILS